MNASSRGARESRSLSVLGNGTASFPAKMGTVQLSALLSFRVAAACSRDASSTFDWWVTAGRCHDKGWGGGYYSDADGWYCSTRQQWLSTGQSLASATCSQKISVVFCCLTMADFVEIKTRESGSIFLEKGGQSAQCKLCKTKLKTVGGSTKGLHEHLKRVHDVTVLKRKIADMTSRQCV